MSHRVISATPSAARLTMSLRDIGYDFVGAVADLIDNSIAASASEVNIEIVFDGSDSSVFIADNGTGLTAIEATEALRFGTRRNYAKGDLGRYGLGLKTASLSQGRRLTLVSRASSRKRIVRRTLDLDTIERFDDWVVVEGPSDTFTDRAESLLAGGSGTVVIWQDLDRVLPPSGATGGWAKRRFDTLVKKTQEHIGMVFHRFLSGENGAPHLTITVNGEKVASWDPFFRTEPATQRMDRLNFELLHEGGSSEVSLSRFILPGKRTFSSPEGFDSAAGPLNWNRQQGLYIYRENRLVQWGGWGGTRGIDEHTKLARASLDFDNDLDEIFNINVAKMRVAIPGQLKQMLERPISELCILADRTYRRQNDDEGPVRDDPSPKGGSSSGITNAEIALALKSAAVRTGNYEALKQIVALLRDDDSTLASRIGF
ncbi:ATP-binding protein [Williamsia sp. SKLECPSW1]